MKKCYVEYLTQFEMYLEHMTKNIVTVGSDKDRGHQRLTGNGEYELTNEENEDDEEEDDDYELESNEFDDDLDEEKYCHDTSLARSKTVSSGHSNHHHNHHYHHHAHDLELDNLSDLSDNFTSSSISKSTMVVSSNEKKVSRTKFKRDAHSSSYKLAWM